VDGGENLPLGLLAEGDDGGISPLDLDEANTLMGGEASNLLAKDEAREVAIAVVLGDVLHGGVTWWS